MLLLFVKAEVISGIYPKPPGVAHSRSTGAGGALIYRKLSVVSSKYIVYARRYFQFFVQKLVVDAEVQRAKCVEVIKLYLAFIP